MAASLDDILTTQKNGVIAINNIGQAALGLWNYSKGTVISSGSAPTGGFGILYTAPTGTQIAIVDIEVCNTATTPGTFTICLVPVGGAAGASTALFYNAPISGNTTVQWTGQQVLLAGGTVQAQASVADITFKIGGGPGQ